MTTDLFLWLIMPVLFKLSNARVSCLTEMPSIDANVSRLIN